MASERSRSPEAADGSAAAAPPNGGRRAVGAVRLGRVRVDRIREALLDWFEAHGRTFAFRGVRDPYLILVAEVVLQQTQVSRGEPAWREFTTRFPSFDALAAASTAEVLRAWAGLGYNRRAVNLQRAARAVVVQHAGRLPEDLDALLRLPGVGPYTARALAALAFARPVSPVDTNVRRVLGRVLAGHGSRGDAGTAMSAADLQHAADALVPPARPAAWTAALMDLGATVCRPRRPRCEACPLARECRYARAVRNEGVAGRAAVPRDLERRTAPSPRSGRSAAVPSPRSPVPSPPFEATSRWLRGRILARLRELPDGAWGRIDAPVGPHNAVAVEAAVTALEREGLLERDGTGGLRLPY